MVRCVTVEREVREPGNEETDSGLNDRKAAPHCAIFGIECAYITDRWFSVFEVVSR